MAAVTFSGLVHYGFFHLDDELQVRDYAVSSDITSSELCLIALI